MVLSSSIQPGCSNPVSPKISLLILTKLNVRLERRAPGSPSRSDRFFDTVGNKLADGRQYLVGEALQCSGSRSPFGCIVSEYHLNNRGNAAWHCLSSYSRNGGFSICAFRKNNTNRRILRSAYGALVVQRNNLHQQGEVHWYLMESMLSKPSFFRRVWKMDLLAQDVTKSLDSVTNRKRQRQGLIFCNTSFACMAIPYGISLQIDRKIEPNLLTVLHWRILFGFPVRRANPYRFFLHELDGLTGRWARFSSFRGVASFFFNHKRTSARNHGFTIHY